MITVIDFDGYAYLHANTGNYVNSFQTGQGLVSLINAEKKQVNASVGQLIVSLPWKTCMLIMILHDGLIGKIPDCHSQIIPYNIINLKRSIALHMCAQYYKQSTSVYGMIIDINFDNFSIWMLDGEKISRSRKNVDSFNSYALKRFINRFLKENDRKLSALQDLLWDKNPLEAALMVFNNLENGVGTPQESKIQAIAANYCEQHTKKINDLLMSEFRVELSNAQNIYLVGSGSRILSKGLLPRYKDRIITETNTEGYLCEAFLDLTFS